MSRGLVGTALAGAIGMGAAGLGIQGCSTTPSRGSAEAAAQAADERAREARALLLQADQARKSGHSEEAIALYRRSLGLDGSNSAAWHNLGTLLIEQKDYMAAASSLRSAADLAPLDPRPLESLGLTYFSAGYDEEALEHYMESLRRDPNWLGSIRGVAMCAYRLHKASDAILEVLGRGVMLERDNTWRQMLQRERIRVEQQLKSEKDAARRESR